MNGDDALQAAKEQFKFPFKLHGFQNKAAQDIFLKGTTLLKFGVGLGKSACSTLAALMFAVDDEEDVDQIWVLCPPILIEQWYEFLSSVKGIPDICVYKGTPTDRAKMDMQESVIIASYNIFRGKNDYKRFLKLSKKREVCIIADELSLKNLKSSTYRKIREILYRKVRLGLGDQPFHKLIALNATPISSLEQTYNWCNLLFPGLYGSKRLFLHQHVEKEDHWGNPVEWRDVKGLKDNLEYISVDTNKTIKLPPLVETITPYHLTSGHEKLYKEVEKAQLNNLPEDKIDLAIRSMFSTLQRLVLAPEEFGLSIRPPILDFVDSYLDQIGDQGILFYTRHVAVSKMLADYIPDSVAVYGKVTKKNKEKAMKTIKEGRAKRLVGNLQSLGHGLNLQMLNHVVYLELPFRDDVREQSLGRTHRQGQTQTCFANYPMAKDTIQEHIYYKLLQNKADLEKVLKTKADVKKFLK